MFGARETAEGLASERRWGFAIFNLILLWPGMVLMVLSVSEYPWTAGRVVLVALYAVLLAHCQRQLFFAASDN